MIEDLEELFPDHLLDEPFQDNDDYLTYEIKRVCRRIKYYIRAKKTKGYSRFETLAKREFSDFNFFIKSRLDASENKFFSYEYISKLFNLSILEKFCLMMGVLIKTDDRYKDMLQNIEGEKTINYSLAIKIYYFVENISDIDHFYSIQNELQEKMNSLFFNGNLCNLDNYIFEIITKNSKLISNKNSGIIIKTPENISKPIIRKDFAIRICEYLKETTKNHTAYYYISGCEGIGKKYIVKCACDILNKNIVYFDLEEYVSQNKQKFADAIMSAYRTALINQAYICLENFQSLIKADFMNQKYIEFILNLASNFSKAVFVLSSEEILFRKYFRECMFMDLTLDELTNSEKFKIWNEELKNLKKDKNLDIQELANKFSFTPLQIKNTVEDAFKICQEKKEKPIDKFIICEAAYNQVSGNLTDKATLIKKKHTWDELVLQKDQKDLIKRACNHIKYKHIVYDKWGMGKRVLYGRGLSVLFTGPPGTGKTMAAQVVANELGLEIYKVDLSKVISKYIGESEKNLGEVFDSAKKSNVILLFDETDALFGKRTEVKDSHDKNANVETSYLLQKMEEYDGITIMTTNFIENIDKAFFRRISYVVHFNFPDAKARKEIWLKMYPKEMPISKEVDFDYLAKNFEIAGGNIKNVALNSGFMAASESESVEMKHIVKALEYEMKKQGKMISKADFKEYGYLI